MFVKQSVDDDENDRKRTKERVEEMIDRHSWVPLKIHETEEESLED